MSSLLSEVESMDTLPFAKSSTPSVEASLEPKLPAPSIEQVDENPEGLRALRGQGRYFGIAGDEDGAKEAEPKCNNCSQRGHFKRDCPHVICTYCGSMDDHYSQHCSKAIKCSNCNEGGHYRSQCPQKWKRVFCTLCNSKKHSRDRCPSIWRVYLLKDDAKSKALPMHRLYCYNCGRKGHFGDDCSERRSSRVPNEDGSAFSGDNLSGELKREYFKNVAKQRREEYSAARYDDFDYDAYEFDDAFYDEPRSSQNKYAYFYQQGWIDHERQIPRGNGPHQEPVASGSQAEQTPLLQGAPVTHVPHTGGKMEPSAPPPYAELP